MKGPGFLITDFINMLQAEFSSEESHKSYCNGREPTRRRRILKPSLQSTLPNCEQPPPDPQHRTADVTGSGEDPVAKGRVLITDFINKLQAEVSFRASHISHCNGEDVRKMISSHCFEAHFQTCSSRRHIRHIGRQDFNTSIKEAVADGHHACT